MHLKLGARLLQSYMHERLFLVLRDLNKVDKRINAAMVNANAHL